MLWYQLRAHRFFGLKFKRQKPIGDYIVDFVCLEKHLVIELDGGQHATDIEYDEKRTVYLKSQGFQILRFWNNQVIDELESALEAIKLAIEKSPSP